ncbi:DUF4190 domain-containing protein [Arthrobacter sp. SIMBA_036]|uniref:DUF4190 domain-containing protein n=1 Tax=Arthrobacter sp. SIMBA_036 TaxID=3085778 RepID=UPI00397E1CDD
MSDQPFKGNEDKPEGNQPPRYVPPAQPGAPEQGATGHGATEQGATGPQFNQAPHSQPQQPAGQGTYTPGDYSQQPPSPYGQPPSPYQQPFGQNSPYGQPNQYGQNTPYGEVSQASPYGQPSYYGMPSQPKVLSIASMCCGIAIFVGFGFFILPQIAAVVLGHLALKREPAGRGMAIAGLVMGYLGLALTVILGIVFFAAIASSTSRYNY